MGTINLYGEKRTPISERSSALQKNSYRVFYMHDIIIIHSLDTAMVCCVLCIYNCSCCY